jgi:hypothetical protein
VASFKWDNGTLLTNLGKLDERANRAVAAAVDYHATQAEGAMKRGAKWEDQTGNARNGLRAVSNHTSTYHELVLAHSVAYGIWLEVRFSGRYAIIKPTLRTTGDELMRTLSKLFARMGN